MLAFFIMVKNLVICLCLIVIIGGCSSQPSPRDVSFEFIYAVLDGDSTAILQYLDIDRMAVKRMEGIPPADSALSLVDFKAKILQDIVGFGPTRSHWKNQRILVNKEIIRGDSAEVEMTFIDQTTGKIEYSMIYLYREDKRWWVYFYK